MLPLVSAIDPELLSRARAFVPARAVTPRRVVVAMSGGVDSSVAAWLLKAAGHDVVGVGLRLAPETPGARGGEGRCCSVDDLTDARRVAQDLGMPFFAIDARERFKAAVLDPFVADVRAGLTPIPCLACNHDVKVGDLQKTARTLGGSLATGHYVKKLRRGDGWALARPDDRSRDQTYYLYGTPYHDIAELEFPLGELDKPFVRALALAHGMRVHSKPDSQEICFVPHGDVGDVVEQHAGPGAPGQLVHIGGAKLRAHDGVHRFTVGQRRGTGVSSTQHVGEGQRLFVVDVDGSSGNVVMGPKEALDVTRVRARPLRTAQPLSTWPSTVRVQVRARHAPQDATWRMVGDGSSAELEVTFAEPVSAVALGQALVCYDGDVLLGGGILIERVDGAFARRQLSTANATDQAQPPLG